jgi:hypothetical protein
MQKLNPAQFLFLLRWGVPQAILLMAMDFKVSCLQIPRWAFARIRTHDPLVESYSHYDMNV